MYIFKRTKLVMIISWIMVILWTVLIFSLSTQTSELSDGLSSRVTQIIVKIMANVTLIDTDVRTIDNMVAQTHNLVRKLAHVGVYFVLGALVTNSCIKTGISGFKAYSYAVLFCIIYAVTDEFHQTFVAGRSGEVFDCIIDTAGAIGGIVLFWIYRAFKTNDTR